MDLGLNRKAAHATGANRGIGAAIAFRLSASAPNVLGRHVLGRRPAWRASEKADFMQGAIVDIDGGSNRAL